MLLCVAHVLLTLREGMLLCVAHVLLTLRAAHCSAKLFSECDTN
jgi:hypothetical protein